MRNTIMQQAGSKHAVAATITVAIIGLTGCGGDTAERESMPATESRVGADETKVATTTAPAPTTTATPTTALATTTTLPPTTTTTLPPTTTTTLPLGPTFDDFAAEWKADIAEFDTHFEASISTDLLDNTPAPAERDDGRFSRSIVLGDIALLLSTNEDPTTGELLGFDLLAVPALSSTLTQDQVFAAASEYMRMIHWTLDPEPTIERVDERERLLGEAINGDPIVFDGDEFHLIAGGGQVMLTVTLNVD